MFSWIYGATVIQQGALLSGVSVAVMWMGIIFIKPILRLFFTRQDDINSVVGNTTSAFSVFYGLLLGLISVATYQNFSNLSDNVTRESSIVAALYRDFSGYDSPTRETLQEGMRRYVRTTIDDDWPMQMKGIVPSGGSAKVTDLYSILTAYEPQTAGRTVLHAETLREFNTFVEVRRTRLANITGGIPGVLWYVVLIGAAFNIILFWLFDMRFFVHLILGGILSFFLGVMILIIVNLDSPFRGEVTVGADPFEAVYDSMMKPKLGAK